MTTFICYNRSCLKFVILSNCFIKWFNRHMTLYIIFPKKYTYIQYKLLFCLTFAKNIKVHVSTGTWCYTMQTFDWTRNWTWDPCNLSQELYIPAEIIQADIHIAPTTTFIPPKIIFVLIDHPSFFPWQRLTCQSMGRSQH